MILYQRHHELLEVPSLDMSRADLNLNRDVDGQSTFALLRAKYNNAV